jgi:hypothetical protein
MILIAGMNEADARRVALIDFDFRVQESVRIHPCRGFPGEPLPSPCHPWRAEHRMNFLRNSFQLD